MNLVIDRIEEEYAVLENMDTRDILNVRKELLPYPIYEGAILTFDGENYTFNEMATKIRRQEILSKFERLKNK